MGHDRDASEPSGISRRALIAAIPAVALFEPAVAAPAATDFATIERQSGGRLGVFVVDSGSGASLAWRSDRRFPFCSSFKAPLAAFVLWQVDRGLLRLDQPVRYGAADLLPYAPVTRAHVAAGALPFSALCAAAVEYSDNTAANLLLRETGGPAALTAWMRARGDDAFNLSAPEPGLNLSRYGETGNTTTPEAMANSYRRFVLGGVLSPGSRRQLADWLIAGRTGDKRLRAGLPPAWRVGDKTGTFGGDWFSTVDVAIGWPPARAPIVMAVFATDTPDTATAERAMVAVARIVAGWAMRA